MSAGCTNDGGQEMRARYGPGYAMVALCLGKITLGEFTGEKQGKEAREEVVGDEHSQAFP